MESSNSHAANAGIKRARKARPVMFASVGAFLARLSHDVVAFIRLPAELALLLRSPQATPPPSAIMPRAKGSKAIDPVGDVQRRQMVHVKTKEECRLANETVDVWSIELPSKHAESILKCVSAVAAPHSCHRHSLTPSQGNQRQHTRSGCHRLAAPSPLRPPALHARPRRRPA